MRGQILTIKSNDYVLASKSIGTKSRKIIRKHILPNCASVIIITTALEIPSAIFTESYLSFLGLGVQPPQASWGNILILYPFKMFWPALMIVLIVLAFNLLGDGLRDAFDPKLRK